MTFLQNDSIKKADYVAFSIEAERDNQIEAVPQSDIVEWLHSGTDTVRKLHFSFSSKESLHQTNPHTLSVLNYIYSLYGRLYIVLAL